MGGRVPGRWYRRALLSVASLSGVGLVVSGLPMGSARAEDPPVEPAPQVSAPVSPEELDFFYEGYVKSAQRKSGLSTPKYLRKLAIKLYNKGYFARV